MKSLKVTSFKEMSKAQYYQARGEINTDGSDPEGYQVLIDNFEVWISKRNFENAYEGELSGKEKEQPKKEPEKKKPAKKPEPEKV